MTLWGAAAAAGAQNAASSVAPQSVLSFALCIVLVRQSRRRCRCRCSWRWRQRLRSDVSRLPAAEKLTST